MKHICSALLTVALPLSLAVPAFAAEPETVHAALRSPRIIVEGTEMCFMDRAQGRREPITYNGTVYIPLTTIGQWMGTDTVWNTAAKTVTITASGAEPVYYSTYAFNDMDIKRLEGTEQYQYDMQNGVDVQLCPDVTVIVNGERKTFANAQGKAVYPILFRDCIYLPHQGVGELLGKQINWFFPTENRSRLNIYTAPTQAELAEAKFYFAEARKHTDAITALLRADAPSTAEEFVDTVRKVQTELKAIVDRPFPAFKGATTYADAMREQAILVLVYYVDCYLPVEEIFIPVGEEVRPYPVITPHPAFWSYTPEWQWEIFTSAFFPEGENYATYFSDTEKWIDWSEEFMASVEAGPDGLTAFTDAADITHWDAVATLAQLGIINGKDGGTVFDSAGIVTRAEAAKLITLMINGGKDLVIPDGTEIKSGFSDTQGHWAEPYIEFCTQEGILSGRGNGTFDPEGAVTKFELLKMVDVMLGYDPDQFYLNGHTWFLWASDIAEDIGLYEGLPDFPPVIGEKIEDQTLTRDEAAQILYNALKVAPFKGVDTNVVDGRTTFDRVYAKREDGTLSTFLYENFGLNEFPTVPAQPGK